MYKSKSRIELESSFVFVFDALVVCPVVDRHGQQTTGKASDERAISGVFGENRLTGKRFLELISKRKKVEMSNPSHLRRHTRSLSPITVGYRLGQDQLGRFHTSPIKSNGWMQFLAMVDAHYNR